MNDNARLYWLLGTLAGVVGLYVWSQTQSGQDFLSGASTVTPSGSSGGGLIEALTQLPQEAVATVDRGFRNNNPGNIEGNLGFTGQTGVDAQGYAVFSSMEYGIRAIAVIIKNYYVLHGLDTVQGIITRWSATDQAAYVANVSAALGVQPTDTIDPTDPNTLSTIVQAIITQENGQVLAATITQSQLDNGVALA